MAALHLRSHSQPEMRRSRQGVVFVRTECGLEANATVVDNETAECHACRSIDAAWLAELERGR